METVENELSIHKTVLLFVALNVGVLCVRM